MRKKLLKLIAFVRAGGTTLFINSEIVPTIVKNSLIINT